MWRTSIPMWYNDKEQVVQQAHEPLADFRFE